jgi:hypothetical protein
VIILERRRQMAKVNNGVQLTRRGKIVLTAVIIAVISWMLQATTPDECKVPINQMSKFCTDLLYK